MQDYLIKTNFFNINGKINIFTDGSCSGNPGPGGCAAILNYNSCEIILSSGYFSTTNNRMELMAAITALETLKNPCAVIINTDSKYLLKGVTQWMCYWKKYDWKNFNKKPIKNIDLWKKLNIFINLHSLQWNWIKGHENNLLNIRCDKIARFSLIYPTYIDFGYLKKNIYFFKN